MKALIIVDVQNDFCPGGALAVTDGDAIVAGINIAAANYDIVVTTQDWHPPNHGSFASSNPGTKPYDMGKLSGRDQIMWPDHCVQRTTGAELHPNLKVKVNSSFTKGTNPVSDSYSGFFDDDGTSTGIDEYLKENGVTEVHVCGLATDYCVKFTALDAVKAGYEVTVLSELCRAVNIEKNDESLAFDELRRAGAVIYE